MQFPKTFQRIAGWTQDVLPIDANNNFLAPGQNGASNQSVFDNFVSLPNCSRNGFPLTSVAVAYAKPAGSALAATLTANLYLWDSRIKQYFANPAGQLTLTAGQIALFTGLPLLDDTPRSTNLDQAVQEAASYLLIVSTTLTAGTYTFVMGGIY